MIFYSRIFSNCLSYNHFNQLAKMLQLLNADMLNECCHLTCEPTACVLLLISIVSDTHFRTSEQSVLILLFAFMQQK